MAFEHPQTNKVHPKKTEQKKEVNFKNLSDADLKKRIAIEALKLTGKACIMSVVSMAAGALTTAMFGAGPIGGSLAMLIAYGAGTATFAPWFSTSIQRMGALGQALLRRKDPRAYHDASQNEAFKRMKTKDTVGKSLMKTAAYAGAAIGTVLFGTALSFIAFSGIPWLMAGGMAYAGYKSYQAFSPGFKTHAKDWYYLKTHPLEGDRIERRDLPRQPGRDGMSTDYHNVKTPDKVTRVSVSTRTALRTAQQRSGQTKTPEKSPYSLTKEAPLLNITIGKGR